MPKEMKQMKVKVINPQVDFEKLNYINEEARKFLDKINADEKGYKAFAHQGAIAFQRQIGIDRNSFELIKLLHKGVIVLGNNLYTEFFTTEPEISEVAYNELVSVTTGAEPTITPLSNSTFNVESDPVRNTITGCIHLSNEADAMFLFSVGLTQYNEATFPNHNLTFMYQGRPIAELYKKPMLKGGKNGKN